ARLPPARSPPVPPPPPAVVPPLPPGTFDQKLPQRLRPPLGDPAPVVGVGRLVLPGNKAAVRRHLLARPEPLRLRQERDHRLGRPRPHTRDRVEDLHRPIP